MGSHWPVVSFIYTQAAYQSNVSHPHLTLMDTQQHCFPRLVSVIRAGVCVCSTGYVITWRNSHVNFTALFTRSVSSGIMLTDIQSCDELGNFHATSEMTSFSWSDRKFWLVQVSRHWSCVWISTHSRRDKVCFGAVELTLMPQLGKVAEHQCWL